MQTFWKNVEDMSLPFLLKYFKNGPETFWSSQNKTKLFFYRLKVCKLFIPA